MNFWQRIFILCLLKKFFRSIFGIRFACWSEELIKYYNEAQIKCCSYCSQGK
uniref:Uncharacterized protein n=1 Tax=Kalanchoe fedtschenkoi TaxID=63787 RepID=A0A7N0V762_KALFE